ncbi:MAG: hypothetical protein JRD94_17970 [Deltaproteobacteria bacterium]|nr:hypothetical protein [Deltaproteobacteria bacterium]
MTSIVNGTSPSPSTPMPNPNDPSDGTITWYRSVELRDKAIAWRSSSPRRTFATRLAYAGGRALVDCSVAFRIQMESIATETS